MKYRVIPLLASIGLLSLSACMQDHPNPSDVRKEVKVSATIDGANSQSVKTRVANSSWEAGDAIGLYMKSSGAVLSSSSLATNAKYVLSDGTSSFSAVSESDKIYFPFHGESVDFIAYYPYKETLNDLNYPVDVSDQSNLSSIDLMYSNNVVNVNASSENVELTFKHQLSNVILNISMVDAPEEDLSELKVEITNVNTKASFSLVDGKLSDESDPANVVFNIASNGKRAEAILLPIESLSGKSLVLTTKESTYSYDLSKAGLESLDNSTKYTFNVKLKLGQGAVIEGVTATIIDWTDGGSKDIIADEVKSENSSTDGEEAGVGDSPNNPPKEDDPPEETGSVGDGTKENPYNVNQVEDIIGETDVWVQGYIVGYYKLGYHYSAENALLKNITIASTPIETDPQAIYIVDLMSSKSTVRENINLKNNPSYLHEIVKLNCDIAENDSNEIRIENVQIAIIDGNTF